ncbi:hypothetical protein NOK12_30250 [Nocardioides sp. OK12]|uniref:transcriptional regulator n=1 Tax=Nocardioides sp. OK12 TaxID=2758661 RepID=UPI0021C3CA22|nr:transcriptional regulator [Nocardioides sp. OK12]GHJ60507.1 hypothetical protein NOK12_30250 [Nocardioides sp. OK12]
MHPATVRQAAETLLARGLGPSEVARLLGVPRTTVRDWSRPRTHAPRGECPRCTSAPLASTYAALLGFYLGDGHVSRAARYHALRISCDAGYPGIVDDVAGLLVDVRPGARVFRVSAPGVVVVQAHWQHWPCLLPQHGPGRKHERPIRLQRWQEEAVRRDPGGFLRGLLHSDGCRVHNWTRKQVQGETRRYDYPRWQFSNRSEDILALCCWALDLVGVAWRRSSPTVVSVSTRAGVARVDALVGPKT